VIVGFIIASGLVRRRLDAQCFQQKIGKNTRTHCGTGRTPKKGASIPVTLHRGSSTPFQYGDVA
jgi:hypothetical protein